MKDTCSIRRRWYGESVDEGGDMVLRRRWYGRLAFTGLLSEPKSHICDSLFSEIQGVVGLVKHNVIFSLLPFLLSWALPLTFGPHLPPELVTGSLAGNGHLLNRDGFSGGEVGSQVALGDNIEFFFKCNTGLEPDTWPWDDSKKVWHLGSSGQEPNPGHTHRKYVKRLDDPKCYTFLESSHQM